MDDRISRRRKPRTPMPEFKREERYIVFKIADLTPAMNEAIRVLRRNGIPTRECVVVESDWPIYEETWENVQRMAEGKPSIGQERDALAAHVDKLHDFLRNAPVGNGVCMCGDEIATHADPMGCGHTPVDEVEYHADCLINEAPETSLAQLKSKWQAEAVRSASAMLSKHGAFGFAKSLLEDYANEIESRENPQ